jgi:hypothetical protein
MNGINGKFGEAQDFYRDLLEQKHQKDDEEKAA